MIQSKLNSKFLIIAFSNDLYKFHYALSMASSIKAVNKNVSVFISGYACNYIRKNWKDYDTKNLNQKFKNKNMGTIEDIFIYCKELNLDLFYCKTALDFLDISKEDITDLINIKSIGFYSILNSYKDEQIVFI